MKLIKNYFILAVVLITSSAIFFACSNDEQIQEKESISKIGSGNRLATICDIIGTTVVSSGTAVVSASSSATYSYTNNTGTPTNITWTLTGVGATFSGGGTTITSTNPVTVVYSSNFVSATLSASGSGGNAQTCNTILKITKSGGGTGSDCNCPYPQIRCTVAVSGGHPYWRFQLDNLQPGDNFVWSQNHAPIFGSLTNSSYIIANPEGPIYSGFTIYCEVSRKCSNGTIKKRKAFYTNYYGGTTTTGKQGFVNIGSVCDPSVTVGLD
jgi:hypothetical protein